MSDFSKTINEAVVAILEDHKTTHGRRFSTHIEGYGSVNSDFTFAMRNIKALAQSMDVVWDKVITQEIDQTYEEALTDMTMHGQLAVEHLLYLLAMIEKLKGGVVHEPK